MASYLITGTARGIGLEFTKQLSVNPEVGTIFAAARNESPALKELIEKSNGKIILVQLEATDPASITQAVLTVEKELGGKGLDVLINNAGIMDYTPNKASSLSGDEMNRVLGVNVTGVHLVTQAFLPLLDKGNLKKIANISTTLGSIAMTEKYFHSPQVAYKVSKAALNMLVAQYALELGPKGFTVFLVSPGWLKTELGGVDYADLEVPVGAKATLDKIFAATKEDNGKFLNIHVKGWENVEGPNVYDGKNPPW